MTSRRPAGPPPDAIALREAALAYLARFAATEIGLKRVLTRRVARWAWAAEAEHGADYAADSARTARAAIEGVVARLAAAGAVDDTAFAAARTRRLARAGKSRVATAAHLAAKGVDPVVAAAALGSDTEAELRAAVALSARRSIGAFRSGDPPDAAGRLRELSVLARAGFPREIAERALRLDRAEADAMMIAMRG